MAPTAHSKFSASASSRLLACPGSYALALKLDEEQGHVRRSSVYSAEGTLAHSLAEACLHTGIEPSEFVGEERKADGFTFEVDEEMADAVKVYVDYVRGLKVMGYSVMLEVRVSPSGLWEMLPALDVDLFGTSDVVAFNPSTRDLRIVDLKFGKGVAVEAKDNTQLLYYAAGALAYLRTLGSWADTVTATIIQPRAHHPAGPIRWHDYPSKDVYDWARTTLYDGVKLALADGGKTLCAGKHCRFCPVQPHCEAAKSNAIETARAAFLAAPATNLPASAPTSAILPQVSLSDAALGDLLNRIEIIGPWIESVKRLAQERLEANVPVPGWKLVPKRPVRKYADADAGPEAIIQSMLDAGVPGSVVAAIKKVDVLSPAQAEKGLGKRVYEDYVAPHVVRVSSGLTLAPDLDPRSALARRSAQEAFGLTAGASNTAQP